MICQFSEATDYIMVPPLLKDLNSQVVLCNDIFFFYDLGCFMTNSCWIKFLSMEYVLRCTQQFLASALRKVIIFYNTCSSNVYAVILDGMFKCLQHLIDIIDVNANGKDEHIGNIKVNISIHFALPYKLLLAWKFFKLISFLRHVVKCLPSKIWHLYWIQALNYHDEHKTWLQQELLALLCCIHWRMQWPFAHKLNHSLYTSMHLIGIS